MTSTLEAPSSAGTPVSRGTARRRTSPRRMRRAGPTFLRHAVLVVASLAAFGPFVWMFLASVKSPAEALAFPPTFLPREWRFDNYVRLFDAVPFDLYYRNSIVVTVATTAGQVLTSLAAGYAFARLHFRGRNVLFVILLAALLVPFEVVFTPLISLLASLGWLNTFQGLIIPNVPSILGAFLFRQFFEGFPTEIEDASRIDGAGVWRRFRSIMAPMAAPMIGSFAILSFVYNWNNFFFQFLAVTRTEFFTLPVGLSQLQSTHGTSFNLLMAGSALAILPVFVVFLLFQRQIVTALSGGLR